MSERLDKIKHNLLEGEMKRLKTITGKSYSLIQKVIAGTRENEKILKAAEMLITHRELSDSIISNAIEQIEG